MATIKSLTTPEGRYAARAVLAKHYAEGLAATAPPDNMSLKRWGALVAEFRKHPVGDTNAKELLMDGKLYDADGDV